MGFIKFVKRRAARFDNLAKKWKGPLGLAPSPEAGAGACFPGNFEILQLQRCVFLHSEAADTVLQLPRKDNSGLNNAYRRCHYERIILN